MQITCPSCKKKTTWEENPWRPFCSERCKLIDLGNWASGEYRIPEEKSDKENEDTSATEDTEDTEDTER